jgi:hypothetical protein
VTGAWARDHGATDFEIETGRNVVADVVEHFTTTPWVPGAGNLPQGIVNVGAGEPYSGGRKN